MARPFAYLSPCWNPLLTSKDGLAEAAPGPTRSKNSNTSIFAPAVSCFSTLVSRVAPTVSSSPTLALVVAPATALFSDYELFKQFIKAYLETQVPAHIAPEINPESCKKPLKARFSDFYYGNWHMDCYQFCQQCKNHFETVNARRPNKISFAALFFRGSFIQQWSQYKWRYDRAVLMIWPEFKNFLQKNPSNFKVFIDNVSKKVKCNSQYQNKTISDWAAYLEYLQSILIEFDSDLVLEENTIIWYFHKDLRPSIKVKIEQ